MTSPSRTSVLERTCELAAAYVSQNAIPASKVPDLIKQLYRALHDLGAIESIERISVELPDGKRIAASVRQDGIVSFLDGKTYKTLKRHLGAHGLTPQSYCSRYGLPRDYPMVAPDYRQLRSHIAKRVKLGHKAS